MIRPTPPYQTDHVAWAMSFRKAAPRGGYFLIESLVYIGVLFVVLGVGYTAADHYIENSVALRRSADDLANALHAGERWRADVRSSTNIVVAQTADGLQLLRIQRPKNEISYLFATNTVFRRIGENAWSPALTHVRASSMSSDQRQQTMAWRWELELQIRAKRTRITPIFTFLATAQRLPD